MVKYHEENGEEWDIDLVQRGSIGDCRLHADAMPWDEPPLDKWFVVSLNHYVRDGQKRIFCAMSRANTIIEARGDDAKSVFHSLKEQAKAWDYLFHNQGMDRA